MKKLLLYLFKLGEKNILIDKINDTAVVFGSTTYSINIDNDNTYAIINIYSCGQYGDWCISSRIPADLIPQVLLDQTNKGNFDESFYIAKPIPTFV